MKKTLLAAALLTGFAGAASAQNSVTMYGLADIGIRYQNVKLPGGNPTLSSLAMASGQQATSRFGLRGVEDLGNGLKATFQLEAGVNLTNGDFQGGFNRVSTLGISSDAWGTILMGRDATPTNKVFGLIDPFFGSFATASSASSFGQNTGRYNQMISYQSPNVAGFVVRAAYSFNTGTSTAILRNGAVTDVPGASAFDAFKTANNTRAVSASAAYTNGPVALVGTFDTVMPRDNLANKPTALKAFTIGGAYDLKVVRLTAAYGRQVDGLMYPGQALTPLNETGGLGFGKGAILFAPGGSANSYMVTASAPIGEASRVMLGWQMMTGSGALKGPNAGTQNVVSAAYTYNLSSRTNLYAYYSYAGNYQLVEKVNSNTVGVGVRHTF